VFSLCDRQRVCVCKLSLDGASSVFIFDVFFVSTLLHVVGVFDKVDRVCHVNIKTD